MKLTDKALSPVHRVLLYGPPKTGKTQLAGALSEHKKLLWFDLENGYATLLKFPEDWKSRIEIISIPDTRSFPIAIETCLKIVKGGSYKICEEHGKISCPICTKNDKAFSLVSLNDLNEDTIVVFDSLTQLTASAIAHITKAQAEDYKMKTDDWASLSKLMDVFLSHIQQAPYNVICISHEVDIEKDEDKPEKLVAVAGSRNTSKNTAKFFDHVVYAQMKNNKHKFYSSTTSSMGFIAGSRTDVDVATEESLKSIFCPTVPQIAKPTAEAKQTVALQSILSKYQQLPPLKKAS